MINWGNNLNLEANKNLIDFIRVYVGKCSFFYQFPPFSNSYIESVFDPYGDI